MNVSKILETIVSMEKEEKELEHLFESEKWRFASLQMDIGTLKKIVLAEQNRQAAVKTGNNDAYKAFLRLLKSASNDNLSHAWRDEKDRLCACNGYVAVRMENASFNPPMRENAPIDMDSLFKKCNPLALTKEENTPSSADLKTYQKMFDAEFKTLYSASTIKAMHGIPHYYRFTDGPLVNIEYLLIILDVLPDAEFYYNPESMVNCLYAKGSSGDALVLPIRPSPEILERATKDSEALRTGTYFNVA